MISFWTTEDIEAIMIQLNKYNFPFKKYEFAALGEGMSLLGSGAFANVYEAVARGKKKKEFAIKVIGFGNKHVDSEAFRNSVAAQKKICEFENDVVKIYDSIELRVWIEGDNDVIKVEAIDPYEETKPVGNYLHLQFILMEKIEPIIASHKLKHSLTSQKLEECDEKEIMKLAYEIGMAIDRAHKNNVIHRDIKLENIFYDRKSQHYKLGDFGIAKTTDDGMASTIAFTKGYGAPEVVGTLDDRYDYTADIYSFGMVLYVLLNEMRFPESTDYRPSVNQYVQGYVPMEPMNGSDELVSIVLKMLSFNPDDRYQSMEEVLNEFEELKFGRRIKYQREHKSLSLALGTVFALIGAVIWKLSFVPALKMDFGVPIYVFFGLCICKSILFLFRKKTMLTSIAILLVGCYLLFSTGFSWRIVILLICVTFGDYLPGILSGSAIVANVTYLIMSNNNLVVHDYEEYRWLAVLLISLSCFLLLLHAFLEERDIVVTKTYLGKNIFWILVSVHYLVLIPMSYGINMTQGTTLDIYRKILGNSNVEWILSWNPRLVGICGICFCLIWTLREWFLIYIEKRVEKHI